jgi:hypothetical protein
MERPKINARFSHVPYSRHDAEQLKERQPHILNHEYVHREDANAARIRLQKELKIRFRVRAILKAADLDPASASGFQGSQCS